MHACVKHIEFVRQKSKDGTHGICCGGHQEGSTKSNHNIFIITAAHAHISKLGRVAKCPSWASTGTDTLSCSLQVGDVNVDAQPPRLCTRHPFIVTAVVFPQLQLLCAPPPPPSFQLVLHHSCSLPLSKKRNYVHRWGCFYVTSAG